MALTLIRETEKRNHVRYALYLCGDCGNETEKRMANVNSGGTSSCGCKANTRRAGYAKNQEQPWEPINSGTSQPPPLPVPSFERVSKSEFQVVPAAPFWLMMQGNQVIGKEPMTSTERRFYTQKAQQQ